ncbi:sigma-70 family RNA polymerase sigma factor [Streptomyces olivochromogenes]|uniref:sigma-70 family RNA polymerase sigma factor n=1 Tax=Streptomyces olivochromogenes TaxID=1963 RepID=UPI001F302CFB|nr:sigma-70 family RNA polymerase sigma factor [Streptomyces olivochromogenes]MCF3136740.1 sigma-70 family RNA polymerase sigma factor [Streptomyces olivochromogenes]
MSVPRATLDRESLAELHRLYEGRLLRVVARLTGDFGRAEDIVQETFLRAWQHPRAFAGGADAALPWLLTVARRLTIDHHRMLSRRAQEVDSEESVESGVPPVDPYDNVLRAWDVARVMAGLPDHHREVLVELYFEDRTAAEVATRMGVPVGTVKSRSHYAMRTLRPILVRRGLVPRCA